MTNNDEHNDDNDDYEERNADDNDDHKYEYEVPRIPSIALSQVSSEAGVDGNPLESSPYPIALYIL